MSTQTTRASGLDGFFKISERGSTVSRELRGGLVTFFTMAYIVVLNPLILGFASTLTGSTSGAGTLRTSPAIAAGTALVAGVMTILMGVVANYPLALAAGLGLNAFVAFGIASQMTWADAMGLVVIEGLIILVLVLTGFRVAGVPRHPDPAQGRHLGRHRAVHRTDRLRRRRLGAPHPGRREHDRPGPARADRSARRAGRSLVFAFGLLLVIALWVRKVKGAILISILATTVFAIVVEAIAELGPAHRTATRTGR